MRSELRGIDFEEPTRRGYLLGGEHIAPSRKEGVQMCSRHRLNEELRTLATGQANHGRRYRIEQIHATQRTSQLFRRLQKIQS